MTLFNPRWPESEFGSLFRLLDEFDHHRATRSGTRTLASFSPRFDVREVHDAYILDGELPGIEHKDINIEFTDPHTLVISGRTERAYEEGAPPGKRIEGGKAEEEQKGKKGEPEHRYWVTERAVGEFSRSFNFPANVNQDEVKASLKNGVLTITVPKAAPPGTKRITVE